MGWGYTCRGKSPGLGSCLKVSEGNPSPFVLFFNTPPFAPKNALLAGGQQEGDLWWEPGMAGGGSGQEFGAGPPAVAAFLALPALPSPGLRTAGSRTSPRRLGHWPLFRRIKLALLLSLSLFQQFLPPLSLGSGETFLPGGCQEKYPPEGHAGMGTGSTMVAGDGRGTVAPLGWASHPGCGLVPILHPVRAHSQHGTPVTHPINVMGGLWSHG